MKVELDGWTILVLRTNTALQIRQDIRFALDHLRAHHPETYRMAIQNARAEGRALRQLNLQAGRVAK